MLQDQKAGTLFECASKLYYVGNAPDKPQDRMRGYGGEGWTITLPDAKLHTNDLRYLGAATATIPGIAKALIQQDPFREHTQSVESPHSAHVAMPLRLPPALGSGNEDGESVVISVVDDRAREFLARETLAEFKRVTGQTGTIPQETEIDNDDEMSYAERTIIWNNETYALMQDSATSLIEIHRLESGARPYPRNALANSQATVATMGSGNTKIMTRTPSEFETSQGIATIDEAEQRNYAVGLVLRGTNGRLCVRDYENQRDYPLPIATTDKRLEGRSVLVAYAGRKPDGRQIDPTKPAVYPILAKDALALSDRIGRDWMVLDREPSGVSLATVILPYADLWMAARIVVNLEHMGNRPHQIKLAVQTKDGDRLLLNRGDGSDYQKSVAADGRLHTKYVSTAELFFVKADGQINEAEEEIKHELEEDQEREHGTSQHTGERTRYHNRLDGRQQ